MEEEKRGTNSEFINVDQRTPVLRLFEVEVSHSDLSKVSVMVFIKVGSVVVLSSSLLNSVVVECKKKREEEEMEEEKRSALRSPASL